jgi:hypothetical protein
VLCHRYNLSFIFHWLKCMRGELQWEELPAGVTVTPREGMLLGQQSQDVTWTFRPVTQTSMHCKASCSYWGTVSENDHPNARSSVENGLNGQPLKVLPPLSLFQFCPVTMYELECSLESIKHCNRCRFALCDNFGNEGVRRGRKFV